MSSIKKQNYVMNDHWFKNLQRRMRNYEKDVPHGLWEDLEKELFKNKRYTLPLFSTEPKEKTKNLNKSLRSIYRICGNVAAILLILIIFFKEEHRKNIDNKRSLEHNVKTFSSESLKILKDDPMVSNKNMVTTSSTHFKNINSVYNKLTGQFDKKENLKIKEIVINNKVLISNKENNILLDKEANESIVDIFMKEKEKIKLISKNKWMAGLTFDQTTFNSEQQFKGYTNASGEPIYIQGASYHSIERIILANKNIEVKTEVKHRTPITFGLSINYKLHHKWSISSGINYSKLITDFYAGTENSLIKSEQSLNYIGIPIQINHTIIEKNNFISYINLGGEIEKPVSGILKTKYIVNNNIINESNENIHSKAIQLSINGGAGGQYNIRNNIGIYVEPSVRYNFNDKSSISTIYKEKSFTINMKFGIRFSID